LYRRYLIDFGSSVSTARSILARQKAVDPEAGLLAQSRRTERSTNCDRAMGEVQIRNSIIITFVYFVRFMVSYPE